MARAERSGAGADRCAPRGAARGGKAQPLFERVAEPMGGRNAAWQPSRLRGQSSGAGVSAAALTGPRAAAQTGIHCRPLLREPLRDSAPPAADSAGEGSHVPLPGQPRAVTSSRVVHTSWGKPVILVG